jgi:phage tail-like protein
MRLLDLTLQTHPAGHRIDLRWLNPDPTALPGIRVVRREMTHPKTPDDGFVVVDGTNLAIGLDDLGRAIHVVSDTGLQGDTVYYYRLYPYTGAPPPYDEDPANRGAAFASSALGSADRMYGLLPAIYRRYDASSTELRRFIDLVGGELDLLESLLRGALDLHDARLVDGRLLPILASWIGWKTDFRRELDGQRNEIRDAPAIFERVGLIPVVNATVKRVSGWESRAKEHVHNVIRSNEAPRRNLWARQFADNMSQVVPETFASSDFALDGRASTAVDDYGIRWLFYHAETREGSRIWYKTSPTFRLPAETLSALTTPSVAQLQRAFLDAGVTLSATATVTPVGSLWHIDEPAGESFVAEEAPLGITVYHTTADPLQPSTQASLPSPSLAPSRPLTGSGPEIEKHTAAALQADTLWVFWSSYDDQAGRWELRYRLHRDGTWSDVLSRLWDPVGTPLPERRLPSAIVDQAGGLWLFWLENDGSRWVLRYNRHDGSNIAVDPTTGWQLASPSDFPLDGGADPRVEADIWAMFHGGAPNRLIWLFWARHATLADPAQTRWEVAFRIKQGINPNAADWGPVQTLPKPSPAEHGREPAARVDSAGNVLLFWSTTRDGSWSIRRSTFDLSAGPAWTPQLAVTTSPFAEGAPLPVALSAGTLLVYGANRPLNYTSGVYRTTETADLRYAGSTTTDTRNAAAIGLRGDFEDFLTYTYDTASGPDDRYRRDTLGLYVTPDTVVPAEIARGLTRLAAVVPEFMAAPDRAVFTVE